MKGITLSYYMFINAPVLIRRLINKYEKSNHLYRNEFREHLIKIGQMLEGNDAKSIVYYDHYEQFINIIDRFGPNHMSAEGLKLKEEADKAIKKLYSHKRKVSKTRPKFMVKNGFKKIGAKK